MDTKPPPDNTIPGSPCGIGPCQPRFLQYFRNVLSFSIFYGFASLVSQTLLTYVNSQVTALEKQFNITSTTTGLILSCNDIGFLCTIIFSSHFGKKRHIPRILGAASFLIGISGILSSLGYFINPVYLPKLSDGSSINLTGQNDFVAPLCVGGNDSDVDKCKNNGDGSDGGSFSWPVLLLGICMALQGVGMSPRISLSTTYIDNNNADKSKSGLHLGIATTLLILGPALALALGGAFRAIPVDLQDTDLTPTHPKWIGAWWLGFLVFGSLCLMLGIPLMFFPKHILPVQKEELVEKKSKTIENIKDLPRSVLRVFKKKIYTMTLIGALFQTFVVSGTQSFRSKYVENEFMVPAYKTNIILGVATIVSVSIGTFSGGVLTSRLRLSRLGNLKVAILATFLALCANAMGFFLGCETPRLYGFDIDDGVTKATVGNGLSECSCDTSSYFPVCAENTKTFFSPCFAGCTNQTSTTYGGCSKVFDGKATAGICETDCPYLYYYIVADALQVLCATVAVMPFYVTLLRSVESRDKTISVGIFQFFMSGLAFIPGPIFFGYVIDTACLIWSYECGIKGACAQYGLENLRYRLKSMESGGMGIGFFFLVLAFITLKIEGGDKEENGDTGMKDEKDWKTEKAESSRL